MELARIKALALPTSMPVGEGGEALEFSYRVGALDPDFWAWFYGPDGARATIYDVIERVCVTTGITVEGAAVPADAGALKGAGVPIQVLHAMFDHVRNEARAGKLSASGSRPTS